MPLISLPFFRALNLSIDPYKDCIYSPIKYCSKLTTLPDSLGLIFWRTDLTVVQRLFYFAPL